MKTRWLAGAVLGLAILLAGMGAAWRVYVHSLGPLDLAQAQQASPVVLDRDGKLLRAFTMPDGRWRLPVTLDDVDPRFVALLLAYEDHRFYAHHGIDLEALGRAALQLALRGHIVSGGSTLTMQVARLIEPRPEKSLGTKIRQIARALEIEAHHRKSAILDLYLVLAPYGGNIEGLRAASLAYFGRSRNASALRKPRCSSLCRKRRKRADPIGTPIVPGRHAISFSTEPSPAASLRGPSAMAPSTRACRRCGATSRLSRRTRQKRRCAPIRIIAFIG